MTNIEKLQATFNEIKQQRDEARRERDAFIAENIKLRAELDRICEHIEGQTAKVKEIIVATQEGI